MSRNMKLNLLGEPWCFCEVHKRTGQLAALTDYGTIKAYCDEGDHYFISPITLLPTSQKLSLSNLTATVVHDIDINSEVLIFTHQVSPGTTWRLIRIKIEEGNRVVSGLLKLQETINNDQ